MIDEEEMQNLRKGVRKGGDWEIEDFEEGEERRECHLDLSGMFKTYKDSLN